MGLVVYDFFSHVFSLDLPWVISFIGQNIFWLVAFFIGASILTQRKEFKSNLMWVFFTVAVVWASSDFGLITGWLVYIPAFLAFHLVSRMATVFFTESIPSLRKHFTGVLRWQFIVAMILFYFYSNNIA